MIFVRDIIRETEKRNDLEEGSILSRNREREIAWPRQDAMLLARRMIGKTYPKLAELFGGMNHTSVMHGCKAARRRCLAKREHLRKVCQIRAKVIEVAR